ncbi:unnamed protein product [Lactuca virosa]|uniref:Uncharacterized protein n=1 Tax=Lactuca virosa TaxID=75947 RepID=A0AAU9MH32_9ASTR|nr:unnamed protein product [Lactuca virosa]
MLPQSASPPPPQCSRSFFMPPPPPFTVSSENDCIDFEPPTFMVEAEESKTVINGPWITKYYLSIILENEIYPLQTKLATKD